METTATLKAVNQIRPTNDPPLTNEEQWKRLMAMPTENVMRCSSCGQLKLLDQFGLDKRLADGHTNKCMDCTRKYNREYRRRQKKVAKAEQTTDTGDKPLRLCTTNEIFAYLREAKTPARFYLEALKEMGYSGTLKVTREVTL